MNLHLEITFNWYLFLMLRITSSLPIYVANCISVVAPIFTFRNYVKKHYTDVILIVD